MNRAAAQAQPAVSPFDLLDELANRALDLRGSAALGRGLLLIAFLAIWPALAYLRSGEELRFALLGLFAPQILPAESQPLTFFLLALLRALFDPGLLVHVLALYLPPILAFRAAARYMSEIYELRDPAIARRFISQAAFHLPRYEKLIVSDDQVNRESSPSAILKIGGPGYLQVNLEFAALFEKVDGTPDLIGPTAERPGNSYTLDGFERYRTVLDLRDQFYRIEQLTARTREGVRVNLQNVQIIFSIQREKAEGGLQNPFPFSRAAVHRLVYHQLPEKWTQTMIDLVTQELVQYIRGRSLGDLLAAVGEPEIAHQVEMEIAIRHQLQVRRQRAERYRQYGQKRLHRQVTRRVLQRIDPQYRGRPKVKHFPRQPGAAKSEPRPLTSIAPRVQLSNFFSDFVEGFPRRAQQHGVSLRWINVGTFYTSQEVIPGQHIEAWQLNASNLARSSPQVLGQLRLQTYRQELGRRLNSLWEFFHQHRGENPEDIIHLLVSHVQEQLRENLREAEQSTAISEEIRRGLQRAEEPVEAYRPRRPIR